MFHIENEQDIRHNLIAYRIISNELEILKLCEDEFSYKDDLVYCVDNLKEYWNIMSEDIHNAEKLKKKEIVLENHLACVINKIESIMMKLYS